MSDKTVMALELVAVFRLCSHCGRYRRTTKWSHGHCWSCQSKIRLGVQRTAVRMYAPHRNIILTDKGRAACV